MAVVQLETETRLGEDYLICITGIGYDQGDIKQRRILFSRLFNTASYHDPIVVDSISSHPLSVLFSIQYLLTHAKLTYIPSHKPSISRENTFYIYKHIHKMTTMTTLLFLALSACINAAPIHTLEKRKGGGGGGGGKGGGGGSKSSSHTSHTSSGSSSSSGGTGTYTLAAWKIVLIVLSVIIFICLVSLAIWLLTKKNKGWWKVKQQKGEKKKFKAKKGGEIPSGEEFEEEEEQARAGEVEQEERKEEEAQHEWENHE